MVGYNTKRNIALFIFMVLDARKVNNMLHYILNGVNLKEVINALHNAGKAFKTHARVNITAFEL